MKKIFFISTFVLALIIAIICTGCTKAKKIIPPDDKEKSSENIQIDKKEDGKQNSSKDKKQETTAESTPAPTVTPTPTKAPVVTPKPKEATASKKDSNSLKKPVPPESSNVQASKRTSTLVKNVDDILVLVNKKYALPSDWEPKDLVEPKVNFSAKKGSEVRKMRKPAAKALEELFSQAKSDGVNVFAVSGYRSFKLQESIFQRNVKAYGSEEKANLFSAYPGESEHQTGLAMDVTCAKIGYGLEETFADTPEGKWLKKNAAQFGFIIRYQKGKEKITGYSYEPWHIRYVGVDAAKYISENDITFEEYISGKK